MQLPFASRCFCSRSRLRLRKQGSQPDWRFAAAFGVSGALFLATKVQYGPCVAPPPGVCRILPLQVSDPDSCSFLGLSVLVMVLVAVTVELKMPKDYEAESRFSLVFLKLAPLSSSPQRALEELGRPPAELAYLGMHAWAPGSPLSDNTYRDRFWHATGKRDVLGFYAHHPAIALSILWQDLLVAGRDIPVSKVEVGIQDRVYTRYGVYRRIDVPYPHARPKGLQVWSTVRRFTASVFPAMFPLIYLVLVPLGIFKMILKSSDAGFISWPLIVLVTGIGAIAFLVGSLADATDIQGTR